MILHNIFLPVIIATSLLFAAAVVFFEHKNPATSLTWVLVLLFLPVIGIIAYLFLGTGFKINKKKRYKLKAINDRLYNKYILKHLNIADSFKFMAAHSGVARLVTYLNNGCGGVYTQGNSARVFTSGADFYPRLMDDLAAARSHIHMLFFIFRADGIGRRMAAILEEKARQGVEVRFIYDSLGSRVVGTPPIFQNMRAAGARVLGFSPVFSNLGSHLRLNYRNHRKITVIDGQIGYIGGMNIGDEYLGQDKKLRPWRDTHLRLTGPAVWFLQERFLMDWAYTSDLERPGDDQVGQYFPEPLGQGRLGTQIISSGPDTSDDCRLKSGLIAQISAAQKNVFIQTPYFAPDESFMDALRIAAQSGVDARLMIPGLGDHWIAQMATLGYAREAVKFGLRVFLYQGFIHSKTVVSDSLVTSIGTTNLTNRSFVLDFEANAFIYDRDFGRENERIFLEDQSNCLEINLAWFEMKGRASRAAYNFARLFAPLM
ncbi:MAG: cardiolipin synthase [Candidatus Adiutrix sp.]|jgi:cardiolipin synthase|nr:cardiolipin synthase [Candidatus Adiutrix sp.]